MVPENEARELIFSKICIGVLNLGEANDELKNDYEKRWPYEQSKDFLLKVMMLLKGSKLKYFIFFQYIQNCCNK